VKEHSAISSQHSAKPGFWGEFPESAWRFFLTIKRTNGKVDYFRRGEKKLQADGL
jgi:hypothetical protein